MEGSSTKPNDHHYVFGELVDILTGQVIPDTHDERYRQKIAKILLEDKGFAKADLLRSVPHEITAGEKKARIKIDFLIRIKDKTVGLIKYAPGSLVTRQLSTIALSRTVVPHQIPIVILTNGEDAHVMDGRTGKLVSEGFSGFPDKESVLSDFDNFSFETLSAPVLDQASRIVFACEIDGACPCDSDVCVIENR